MKTKQSQPHTRRTCRVTRPRRHAIEIEMNKSDEHSDFTIQTRINTNCNKTSAIASTHAHQLSVIHAQLPWRAWRSTVVIFFFRAMIGYVANFVSSPSCRHIIDWQGALKMQYWTMGEPRRGGRVWRRLTDNASMQRWKRETRDRRRNSASFRELSWERCLCYV